MKSHSRKVLPLAIVAAVLGSTGFSVMASSHREAPFTTEIPKVDSTDWYMFRSYEASRLPTSPTDQGFVTLVANYLPFQTPDGGPNFFFLDPEALYEMHVDNNGDAREDITFQFRFTNALNDIQVPTTAAAMNGGTPVSIPLINSGAFGPNITTAAPLNIIETYTVRAVRGDRRSGFGTSSLLTRTGNANAATNTIFNKPADNFGSKSISKGANTNELNASKGNSASGNGDYTRYANNHIFNVTIPGCPAGKDQGKVFVGQRQEPFYINIGGIFDLINLNPLAARNSGPNSLADKNITSLAIEVPTECLTQGGDGSRIIGGWQTASLRQGRLLNPNPGSDITSASREGGAYSQVSRLSSPLVNELVIGVKDKNKFNTSKPRNDAQFGPYVTNPTVPVLIQLLFNVPAPIPPRLDLVQVFLTGVPNVNQPPGFAPNAPVTATMPVAVPAEMMRLNTGIAPTIAAMQSDLGATGCFVNGVLTLTAPACDPAGYPNGRRPIDDAVDITLRAAEGVLLPNHNAAADVVNDGALRGAAGSGVPGRGGAATDFKVVFPYLNDPNPGSPNRLDLNGLGNGVPGPVAP